MIEGDETFEEVFPAFRPQVLAALKAYNFVVPSEIQKRAIAPAVRGENLIAQAASGSGKTVAFALAILNLVDLNFTHEKGPFLYPLKLCPEVTVPVSQRLQCVVVTPTREVALQVTREITKVGWLMIQEGGFSVIACVGGVPIHADLLAMRIRRPHVLVATTGRLLSLLQDESSECKQKQDVRKISRRKLEESRWSFPPISTVVFDEADRLLSDNFKRQTLAVVSHLQKARRGMQTLFYSATYPPHLLTLTEQIVFTLATIADRRKNSLGEDGDPKQKIRKLETEASDEAEDDELNIVVDGVSPEPPEGTPPARILRKCFLVSSFIRHQRGCNFVEVAPIPEASLPLRMDESTTVENASHVSLSVPVLEKVICKYLSVDLEDDLFTVVDKCVDSFTLKDEDIEDSKGATPKSALVDLVKWLEQDPEWDHWPDLVPKFLVALSFLWQQLYDGDSTTTKKFFLFCNDSFSGTKISQTLTQIGIATEYVSGRMSQEARMSHLNRMEAGQLRGLVCSDVLARGIDLPDLDVVLCIDIPDEKETVLHRIGRAGRYGRSGECLWVVRAEDELDTLKLFSVQTGFPLGVWT